MTLAGSGRARVARMAMGVVDDFEGFRREGLLQLLGYPLFDEHYRRFLDS
jgi:hypothetical protein